MKTDYDEMDLDDFGMGEEIILFLIAVICLICLPFGYLIQGITWCYNKLKAWAYACDDHSL